MSETKKSRISTESVIKDIATSIESIASTIESVNNSHSLLLRLNKSVVKLNLQLQEKQKEELQTSISIPEGN